MKSPSHVKNPLTIIAIFAGLAEVSGTAVLPILSPEPQQIYVWFLMLFPCLLIILFFATLNFNHKVLYAPSDFTDESHFMDLFGKATPLQKEQEITEEILKIQQEEISSTTPSIARNSDIRSQALLAEQFALSRLEEELRKEIRTDPVFNTSGERFMLDGLVEADDELTGIEVKYLRQSQNASRRIREAISTGTTFFANLPPEYANRFKFRFIVALVCESDEVCRQVRGSLQTFNFLDNQKIPIQIRVYTLPENDLPDSRM
jgi:hypothetical protein